MGIKRTVRSLAVLLLFAVVFAIVPQVGAQGSCPYGRIYDETGTLDQDAICSQLEGYSDQAFSVVILFTDMTFASEDSWYAYLDEFEIRIGERNPDPNAAFPLNDPNYLAFEFTSDASYGTIERGDRSYDVFYDNLAIQMKGHIQQGIRQGDPTGGFVTALSEGYQVAYPPAPEPQEQPVQPDPQVEPEPQVQPQPEVTPEPRGNFWGTVLLVLIFGVGAVAVIFGVVAYGPTLLKNRGLRSHLNEVKRRTNRLLNNVTSLIPSENPEDNVLYQLLLSYGLENYPEMREEVLEWFRRSIAAREEALAQMTFLNSDEGEALSLENQVEGWERLWLTLVGNDPTILEMSDSEMSLLLDPTADIPESETIDDQIVNQLRDYRRQFVKGSLQIDLMTVSPEEVDQEGILGYFRNIKDQLSELRTAKKEAEPKIMEAMEARNTATSGHFPTGLTANEALADAEELIAEASASLDAGFYVTALRQASDALATVLAMQAVLPGLVEAANLFETAYNSYVEGNDVPSRDEAFQPILDSLNQAYKEMEEADYDAVDDRIEDIHDFTGSLGTIVTELRAALGAHEERMVRIGEIGSAGFDLSHTKRLVSEVSQDHAAVLEALVDGDYAEADELVKELVNDSIAYLEQAEAIVVLHSQVETRLVELSSEVARVTQLRIGVVPEWDTLSLYPDGNHRDLSDHLANATNALRDLFDDPNDPDDLASKIDRLNSEKKLKSVSKAEDALDKVFKALGEAEEQLHQISGRLTLVREIESEVGATLVAVEDVLGVAENLVDQDDSYVDADVDNMIANASGMLTQARRFVDSREFTLAQVELTNAHELARTAVAESEEQISVIRDLFTELNTLRPKAVGLVDQVGRELNSIEAAALKGSTQRAATEAFSHLREAQAAESAIAGQEDHDLARVLVLTNKQYNHAIESAESTLTRIRADAEEYQTAFQQVGRAISDAESAISSARSRVGHGDAGGAGRSALNRANDLLPSSPNYGIALDGLRRIISLAQQAESEAGKARSAADRKIRAAEEARERARREAKRAADRAAAEARRRASYSRSSSSYGSSSRSHRTSSSSSFRTSSSSRSHRSSGGSRSHRI